MKLEAASEADAELAYAIKQDAYAPYAVEAYGVWDEDFHRQFIRKNLLNTRLIIVNGAVVGWVAVQRGPQEHEILDVHILPAHQRKGYGRAVLRAVIAEAGDKPVSLSVLKINPARALYERLGFAAAGETATHVLMRRLPLPQASPPGSGSYRRRN